MLQTGAIVNHSLLSPSQRKKPEWQSSCPAQQHRTAVAHHLTNCSAVRPAPAIQGEGQDDACQTQSNTQLGTFPNEFAEDEDANEEGPGRPPKSGMGKMSSMVSVAPDDEKNRIAKSGVKQTIYVNWIKEEIEREQSCLELPFTVGMLFAFSLLSTVYLGQETVTIVSSSVVNDLTENANFAFAHYFGHKGISDVNSYADFWSWCRLGFIPLLVPKDPWVYSENLALAVPQHPGVPHYSPADLPIQWPMPKHRRPVPVRGDYLRFNRFIGGIRFRQEVATADSKSCILPANSPTFHGWLGKPCTDKIEFFLPPDLSATEKFGDADRTEWFLFDVQDHDMFIQTVIDMEDGCSSALAQNRSCLCEWCLQQTPRRPWLDERTQRVELSFVLYNAQYGMHCMVVVDFWFSRSGHIYKLINAQTSWAGLEIRDTSSLAIIVAAGVVWVTMILWVARSEAKEIFDLIRTKAKPWYLTLSDDYFGFWNCIDWISIFIVFIICYLFVDLQLSIVTVNELLGNLVQDSYTSGKRQNLKDYQVQVQDYYSVVDNMTGAEQSFRMWLCGYPLVVMLRLFKSFAAQPRLAVVTNTFKHAWDDLLHFAIVFLSVYFCMTINAVLFFGQDCLDFATIDRALHTTFRAFLGDLNWDDIRQIGLIRAFLWYFAFMVVLVMIILNILLVIIMESYAQVKDMAANEASVAQQVRNMIRRFGQTRRGERVNLKDIWNAILRHEDMDEEAMVESQRALSVRALMQIVPKIPKSQAVRTLANSQTDWNALNHAAFDLQSLQDDLDRTSACADELVLISAWLSNRMQGYHKTLTEASGKAISTGLEDPWVTTSTGFSPRSWGQEDEASDEDCIELIAEQVKERIERGTTEILQELLTSLQDGIKDLEGRQANCERDMDSHRNEMEGLRNLICALSQSCDRISQLTVAMQEGGQPPEQIMTSGATAAPHPTRLTQRRPRHIPSHDNANTG